MFGKTPLVDRALDDCLTFRFFERGERKRRNNALRESPGAAAIDRRCQFSNSFSLLSFFLPSSTSSSSSSSSSLSPSLSSSSRASALTRSPWFPYSLSTLHATLRANAARPVSVLPPREDSREVDRAVRSTVFAKGRPAGENNTDRRMTARAQVGQVPEQSESEGGEGRGSRESRRMEQEDRFVSLSLSLSLGANSDILARCPGDLRFPRTLNRLFLSVSVFPFPSCSSPTNKAWRDVTHLAAYGAEVTARDDLKRAHWTHSMPPLLSNTNGTSTPYTTRSRIYVCMYVCVCIRVLRMCVRAWCVRGATRRGCTPRFLGLSQSAGGARTRRHRSDASGGHWRVRNVDGHSAEARKIGKNTRVRRVVAR